MAKWKGGGTQIPTRESSVTARWGILVFKSKKRVLYQRNVLRTLQGEACQAPLRIHVLLPQKHLGVENDAIALKGTWKNVGNGRLPGKQVAQIIQPGSSRDSLLGRGQSLPLSAPLALAYPPLGLPD